MCKDFTKKYHGELGLRLSGRQALAQYEQGPEFDLQQISYNSTYVADLKLASLQRQKLEQTPLAVESGDSYYFKGHKFLFEVMKKLQ